MSLRYEFTLFSTNNEAQILAAALVAEDEGDWRMNEWMKEGQQGRTALSCSIILFDGQGEGMLGQCNTMAELLILERKQYITINK